MKKWKLNFVIFWAALVLIGTVTYVVMSYQFRKNWTNGIEESVNDIMESKISGIQGIVDAGTHELDGTFLHQLLDVEKEYNYSFLFFRLPIPYAYSFEVCNSGTGEVLLDDDTIAIERYYSVKTKKQTSVSPFIMLSKAEDYLTPELMQMMKGVLEEHKDAVIRVKRYVHVMEEPQNPIISLDYFIPSEIEIVNSNEKKVYKTFRTSIRKEYEPSEFAAYSHTYLFSPAIFANRELYLNAFNYRLKNLSYPYKKCVIRTRNGEYQGVNYSITLVLDDQVGNRWFHIVSFITIVALFGCVGVIYTFSVFLYNRQRAFEQELTNAVAHDMKSGLMVISGYSENLIAGVDEETKSRYEGKIMEETRDLNQTVERMLTMTRMKNQTTTLNITEVNVEELVAKDLERYQMLFEKQNLKVHHLSGSFHLLTDELLLEMALDNFLSNAVKYATPGTDVVISTLNHRFEITNYWTVVEDLKKKPKRFWKAYSTGSMARTNGTGNGLGLSIAADILKRLNLKYGVLPGDDAITFWFTTK